MPTTAICARCGRNKKLYAWGYVEEKDVGEKVTRKKVPLCRKCFGELDAQERQQRGTLPSQPPEASTNDRGDPEHPRSLKGP